MKMTIQPGDSDLMHADSNPSCFADVSIDGHGSAATFVVRMQDEAVDSAHTKMLRARLERIVLMVNLHNELVAALQTMMEALERLDAQSNRTGCIALDEVIQARAILARFT